MKTSDYIIEYLIEKGIADVFGCNEAITAYLKDVIFDCRLEG